MLKTITIISSLLLATSVFAGKDGKDYFVKKSTDTQTSGPQQDICSIEYVVTKGKDGKDYFVLKNGIVIPVEDYPCPK